MAQNCNTRCLHGDWGGGVATFWLLKEKTNVSSSPETVDRRESPILQDVSPQNSHVQSAATPIAVVAPSARHQLAPEDQTFIDNRRGNGWGDRCYLHIQKGQLDWAEAACERGLESSPVTWTEGALWYNLGLIAEKRGLPDLAVKQYSKSLAVRSSGNGVDTVKAALARVSAAADSRGQASRANDGASVRAERVSASSYIKNAGGKPGGPEQSMDGDPKTAWQSYSGNPVGQWLEYEFPVGTTLDRALIKTAYDATSATYGDLFALNAHAREIAIIVDGQQIETKTVGPDDRDVEVTLRRNVRTLRLRFDAVFPGSKWPNDLSISEVTFFRSTLAAL